MLDGSYTIIDIKKEQKEIISKYLEDWESHQKEDESQFITTFIIGKGYEAATATLILNKKSNNPFDNYVIFVGANARTNGEGLLKKIIN
jgi:hypothetical protein